MRKEKMTMNKEITDKSWFSQNVALPPFDSELDAIEHVEYHSVNVLLKEKDEILNTTAYFNFTFNSWTLPDEGILFELKEREFEWIQIEMDEDKHNEMYDVLLDTYGFLVDFSSSQHNEYEITQGADICKEMLGLKGDIFFLVSYAYQKHLQSLKNTSK